MRWVNAIRGYSILYSDGYKGQLGYIERHPHGFYVATAWGFNAATAQRMTLPDEDSAKAWLVAVTALEAAQ